MIEKEIRVHTSHCCYLHGCKYGEDSICPVVNNAVEQKYICETCYSEDIKSVEEIKQFKRLEICCDKFQGFINEAWKQTVVMEFNVCPFCAKKLSFKEDEKVSSSLIVDKSLKDYAKGYVIVGGFNISDEELEKILIENNVKTEVEAIDIIERYIDR